MKDDFQFCFYFILKKSIVNSTAGQGNGADKLETNLTIDLV